MKSIVIHFHSNQFVFTNIFFIEHNIQNIKSGIFSPIVFGKLSAIFKKK